MKALNILTVFVFSSALMLTGCIRTYKTVKDRADQDLTTGNHGYLYGRAPEIDTTDRKMSRQIQVLEVELRNPFTLGKDKKQKSVSPDQENVSAPEGVESITTSSGSTLSAQSFQKYTVEKNDTLQKISQKFYGTTKKWKKIFNANKTMLKTPDKLYPGQTLNIPVEAMKEPKENLK